MGELTGAIVKFADVMVDPVEVEDGAPLVVVVAAGVGPPVMVVDVRVGVITVAAAVFEVVLQPVGVVKEGPLVLALYANVGAPAPTVVTVWL